MKFADIPANETVKEQLRALVDADRLPHALLLQGPRGIGKMMMARALAQYIHCTNRHDGDSCGTCPSCRQSESFNHIDTYYSYPVLRPKSGGNTTSEVYAPEWREFLESNPYMEFTQWQAMLGNPNGQPTFYVEESAAILHRLSFTAHASKYIVVVMWLPEKMSESVANKLLKIIEEPHPDTKFILVSNEPAKILPTIYSRLNRIEMKRLPDDVVASWLMERYPIEPARAAQVAHLSEGSVLNAAARLDSEHAERRYLELFMQLMRQAYQRNVGGLSKWIDDVAELKREGIIRFLSYCERLIGENYIFNLRNPQLVYLDEAESRFSTNFSPFINERNVEQLRQLMVDARMDIAGNAYAQIVLFDVAMQTIMLLKR